METAGTEYWHNGMTNGGGATVAMPDAITYQIPFEPEVRHLIPEHWFTYPPAAYSWHVTLAVVVFILGVISLCGNAAVIYIFGSTKGLRNPSNALIINLAISDFGMMVTNCPLYFISSVQGRWTMGPDACRFYGFTGALFGTVSLVSIAAIALDRYLVIWCVNHYYDMFHFGSTAWYHSKPFLVMKSAMTRGRAKFAIAICWIYGFAWAIPPLCGVSNYVLEGFLTACTFDYLDPDPTSRAFILAMFVCVYVVMLSVIIVAYMLIIAEVYRHAKQFKTAAVTMPTGMPGSAQRRNEEMVKKRKEVQTAKIAAIITICWVVAWTPYAVVALMGISTGHAGLTPVLAQIPALFAKTAAVYNPLGGLKATRRFFGGVGAGRSK